MEGSSINFDLNTDENSRMPVELSVLEEKTSSKAPFVSIEIDFRKSIFGKSRVWLCCKIRSNLKNFNFHLKISQKQLKLVSVVIFTSIGFLPSLTRTSLSHMHCSVKPSLRRNHPHRRTTIAISPVTGTAPIDVDRDRDRDLAIDASRDRDCADRRRSRSSKSARLRSRSRRSRAKRRSRSHREIDLSFWVLFEFLGMNDIMCLFGS